MDFGPFALCVLRDERCDACGKPTYKCCVGDGCSVVKGGLVIPQASRSFNDASLDMGRPPQTSRAYSRSGRAALTAGTLTPVGDNTAREDVHGNVEVRDLDGYDADVMHYPCDSNCCTGNGCDCHEREVVRQARLRRWQAIR